MHPNSTSFSPPAPQKRKIAKLLVIFSIKIYIYIYIPQYVLLWTLPLPTFMFDQMYEYSALATPDADGFINDSFISPNPAPFPLPFFPPQIRGKSEQ